MPPQFVYFDLGNVLCTFDRDRALRQMATVCGAPVEAVRAAVLDAGLQADLERGRCDWLGFHEAFSSRTGTTSDPLRLAAAASEMFDLHVPMLPILAGLARLRCRCGILSNTCDVHWSHLVSSGYAVLPGTFEQVVLSHEVGAVKPDPAIFAAAAERAGVAVGAIFFCDDLPEHVAAARKAGWDAALFTSADRLIDDLERRGLDLGL